MRAVVSSSRSWSWPWLGLERQRELLAGARDGDLAARLGDGDGIEPARLGGDAQANALAPDDAGQGGPGERRAIVQMRQVCERDHARKRAPQPTQKLGRLLVRQVAEPAADALLERAGIAAILEHLPIVVGLE